MNRKFKNNDIVKGHGNGAIVKITDVSFNQEHDSFLGILISGVIEDDFGHRKNIGEVTLWGKLNSEWEFVKEYNSPLYKTSQRIEND